MMRPFSLSLVLLVFSLWVSLCNAQSTETEQFESTDYIGDMDSFDRDSGTIIQSGKYKTGHKNKPGTYDKDFDLESQMSISEINAGFDLEYGVTVNSHSSNSRLNSCTSITQNSDCRDIFKLTVKLFDANEVVKQFIHEVELDFTGNRNYSYNQTIEENLYQSLTGNFELYGVDAGYPSGWYGPQFSDPFLTTAWEVTTIINEEILNLLEHSDILDVDTDYDSVAVVVETPEGEIMQEFSVEVEQDMDMAMAVEIETDFELPVIEEFDMPVEVDIGEVESSTIEMDIEAEMEVEVVEPETVEQEPERVEDVAEAEPEPTTPTSNNETENETEEVAEPTKKEKVVAEAKQKVANKIVKNMGDKGKYDTTNQIKTLVVMQVLGNTNTFFDSQKQLQDTQNFFNDNTVPDNIMSDSNYAQYILFGGSDAAHSEIVDSQYQ